MVAMRELIISIYSKFYMKSQMGSLGIVIPGWIFCCLHTWFHGCVAETRSPRIKFSLRNFLLKDVRASPCGNFFLWILWVSMNIISLLADLSHSDRPLLPVRVNSARDKLVLAEQNEENELISRQTSSHTEVNCSRGLARNIQNCGLAGN